MHLGLRTARALVVDDNYGEARPVLLALSRLGIGSVYLNGDIELLDENRPFRGIRLAFVDMDLQGVGDLADEELGRQAAAYLARAVSSDNGLLAVLVWTKHLPAADAFFAEIRNLLPRSAVLDLGVEQKPGADEDESASRNAVSTIVQSVSQQLKSAPGIHLLWEWEEVTHHATTATSESLIEVVRNTPKVELSNATDVSSALSASLGLLAAAARDRRAQTGVEAASHALSALIPILEDAADHPAANPMSISEPELAELLSATTDQNVLKDKSNEGRARYGRLNRMVHISRVQPGAPLLPGNVYEVDDKLDAAFAIDRDRLFFSLVSGSYKKNAGHIEPRVVIAEVTPACDYAQGKVEIPRVLGGALIPTDRLKKVPSNENIYKSFGVFHFDGGEGYTVPDGTYHFVFNARFFTGLPRDTFEGRTPLFRIRQNTLVDIQAWLARHGNRPGVITIAS